jgi:hypothetical protein
MAFSLAKKSFQDPGKTVFLLAFFKPSCSQMHVFLLPIAGGPSGLPAPTASTRNDPNIQLSMHPDPSSQIVE